MNKPSGLSKQRPHGGTLAETSGFFIKLYQAAETSKSESLFDAVQETVYFWGEVWTEAAEFQEALSGGRLQTHLDFGFGEFKDGVFPEGFIFHGGAEFTQGLFLFSGGPQVLAEVKMSVCAAGVCGHGLELPFQGGGEIPLLEFNPGEFNHGHGVVGVRGEGLLVILPGALYVAGLGESEAEVGVFLGFRVSRAEGQISEGEAGEEKDRSRAAPETGCGLPAGRAGDEGAGQLHAAGSGQEAQADCEGESVAGGDDGEEQGQGMGGEVKEEEAVAFPGEGKPKSSGQGQAEDGGEARPGETEHREQTAMEFRVYGGPDFAAVKKQAELAELKAEEGGGIITEKFHGFPQVKTVLSGGGGDLCFPIRQ